MFPVISKRSFTEDLYQLEIQAAPIAASAGPGHYVDIHINPDAPAITLPIVLTDPARNTFTVVERAHDLHSEQLMMLAEGDEVFQVRGPVGTPCTIDPVSKIVLAADGMGVASLLWRARVHRNTGAHTICVVGYPSRDAIYWENEFVDASNELYVVTEDGSYGVSGSIAGPVRGVCETHKDVERLVAISSVRMMKRIAKMAANAGIDAAMSFDAERNSLSALRNGDGKLQGTFDFVTTPEVPADSIEFDKLLARLRAANRTGPDTAAA